MAQCHRHDIIIEEMGQNPANAAIAEFQWPSPKHLTTGTQPHRPDHQAKDSVGQCPDDFEKAHKQHTAILSVNTQP